MATSTPSRATRRDVREVVMDRHAGWCQLGCGRFAANYAHRLPQGQGGPFTMANGLGLCGSGTTGCHWRTEQARALSYDAGWLLRTGSDPATTPALIVSFLGAGWHILGDPDGVRLAEAREVPGHMWRGDFWDARARLLELTAGSAA